MEVLQAPVRCSFLQGQPQVTQHKMGENMAQKTLRGTAALSDFSQCREDFLTFIQTNCFKGKTVSMILLISTHSLQHSKAAAETPQNKEVISS